MCIYIYTYIYESTQVICKQCRVNTCSRKERRKSWLKSLSFQEAATVRSPVLKGVSHGVQLPRSCLSVANKPFIEESQVPVKDFLVFVSNMRSVSPSLFSPSPSSCFVGCSVSTGVCVLSFFIFFLQSGHLQRVERVSSAGIRGG